MGERGKAAARSHPETEFDGNVRYQATQQPAAAA